MPKIVKAKRSFFLIVAPRLTVCVSRSARTTIHFVLRRDRRLPAFACRESEREEAADLPSRFRAVKDDRERLGDVDFALPCPTSESRLAALHVLADTVPLVGGFRSTPARRAFDKPIAIACLAERAPCLPSRIW
jgi:hypothetical protein